MTRIVGIVNVTPDSFSDGGVSYSPNAALAHMRQLIADGADVIDVGAESTRPGASPVSAEQEWQRLEPVIAEMAAMAREANCVLSVDTRHVSTIEKLLPFGVGMINDVSGGNEAIWQALDEQNVDYVLMHSQSIPVDPAEQLAADIDPVDYLNNWFKNKKKAIDKYRLKNVIFDPGIGFGKSAKQSAQILARSDALRDFGVPLYVGHSRKSFMKLFTQADSAQRDDITLAFSAMLMAKGVDYIRVHDVARHVALREQLS